MRFSICALGFLAVWIGWALRAQEVPAPKDETVPTLHVYTNTIQVPVLVLDRHRRRLVTRVPENRFSVSIDSGPWFRATHVRQEGDDPISLSILLDVSGSASKLMPMMNTAIAALAPTGLHAKDHVSIYALDCSLVQSLNDVAADSEGLRVGVNQALQTWTEATVKCEQSIHLWDALVRVVTSLSKLPGRRAVLAVTEGHDVKSDESWTGVSNLAQETGVTIFGIRYIPSHADTADSRHLSWSSEDPLVSLCELSGGAVLLSPPSALNSTLHRFVTLVRERYIVEFPRPANATAGIHVQQVRVEKSNDFIRPAGISVPIPDPSVLADPTTVPSDPSRTPVLGTRKPMTIPQ
jgi:hypothetical protein